MPAPSETSIANAALVLLGERRISSLDANTKTANTLQERYAEVRDETLRAHPWNFATTRTGLAKEAAGPVWGFDNQFQLPVDCLRLIEIEGSETYEHQVEGRMIVTNHGTPLNIVFTRQVTVVTEFDVMFRQAFAASLAADVCEAITGSTDQVQTMLAIRQEKIRMARVPDGQEPSPTRIIASEWLDAREEQGFSRKIPTGSGTPFP